MTDWWMYHGDDAHSGNATSSLLTSSNVNQLGVGVPVTAASAAEYFQTAPVIAGGKVFIGSTALSGNGGPRLYRIDLTTWIIEESYPLPSDVLGSPAVVDGFVYFTTLQGKVYCLDAFDFAGGPRWVTDLVNRDVAHRQYVKDAPNAWCWTSPLVVDNRVFVGIGQGDMDPGSFGFVRCLEADSGNVLWLFCTCQAEPDKVAPNLPNFIPPSLVTGIQLPPPFQAFPADPPHKGAAVWSSAVFDERNRVIVVGTGNSYPDTAAPAPLYGAGAIALDIDTGELRGSFTSGPTESYQTSDEDIDFGASPTMIYTRSASIVGIGGKSGSYYLLHSPTLKLLQSRQLIPYVNNDPAKPVPGILNHNNEGDYGTLSAAAIYKTPTSRPGHGESIKALFTGVGLTKIDSGTTPFIRALSFPSLEDAWPTTVGADGVTRYDIPGSPLYNTHGETGLCSPVVANDVVFISTTTAIDVPGRVALYAFNATTGVLLWSTRTLPTFTPPGPGEPTLAIGMAISGGTVVFACQNQVFRCTPQPPGVLGGAPLAVVSADPGEIDVWLVSAGPPTNAVMYAANFNDTRGTWTGWSAMPAGIPGLPPGAPVMALSRLPGLIDIFAAGTGGIVYTTAFTDQLGSWNGWSPLPGNVPGLPPGGAVTVIARQPGNGHWLDAWATGNNGVVYTNPYNDTRGTWAGWAPLPGNVPGLPPGAPVMALSRLPGLIDIFAAGTGGIVYTTAFTDQLGSWNGWSPLPGNVPGLPPGGAVTVIARQPGNGHWLDAWATGNDAPYTASYNDTRGTWTDWISIPP